VANQVLAMVEDDPGQVSAVNVGSVIDSTVPALFDAVRPALWAEGTGDPALSYLARPGTALVVNRDTGAAVVQRATQLLVLHLNNPAGHQVQVVRVSAADAASVLGPVGGPAVPVPVPAAPPLPAQSTGGARGLVRRAVHDVRQEYPFGIPRLAYPSCGALCSCG
jgi:hypothetical protein